MKIVTPSEPKGEKTLSQQALVEFKVAVDIWVDKMDDHDRQAAINYVRAHVALLAADAGITGL
jgi:hypothetical protein